MKFIFETDNINEKKYKKFVYMYIIQNTPKNKRRDIWKWNITFKPSTESHLDPHFHGEDGVGGVTGLGKITMYIHDEVGDIPWFWTNALATSHELAHMIGIVMGWREKIPLRMDDFSGHKKGTLLNKSTQEIHDRHSEKRLYTMKYWYVDWRRFRILTGTARVLDFRDNA